MNRRASLKSLGIIAAGIALLPGCSDGLRLTLLPEDDIQLTDAQATWLTAISQAILPYGDREVETLESFATFAVNMISQTWKKKDQEEFISGYNINTDLLKEQINSNAKKIASEDIINFFKARLEIKPDHLALPEENEALAHGQSFINQVRALSIYHLTTSQSYMTEVDDYNIIPGIYQGAVEV